MCHIQILETSISSKEERFFYITLNTSSYLTVGWTKEAIGRHQLLSALGYGAIANKNESVEGVLVTHCL